jgi:hypothetical protein
VILKIMMMRLSAVVATVAEFFQRRRLLVGAEGVDADSTSLFVFSHVEPETTCWCPV